VIGEGFPEEKPGEEPNVHSHPCVVLACNHKNPRGEDLLMHPPFGLVPGEPFPPGTGSGRKYYRREPPHHPPVLAPSHV